MSVGPAVHAPSSLHRSKAVDQKVDEQPDPKRDLTAEGVKRVDRLGAHRQIGEHRDEPACGDILGNGGAEQVDDAGAVQRRQRSVSPLFVSSGPSGTSVVPSRHVHA
jgi:hypothetical protein